MGTNSHGISGRVVQLACWSHGVAQVSNLLRGSVGGARSRRGSSSSWGVQRAAGARIYRNYGDIQRARAQGSFTRGGRCLQHVEVGRAQVGTGDDARLLPLTGQPGFEKDVALQLVRDSLVPGVAAVAVSARHGMVAVAVQEHAARARSVLTRGAPEFCGGHGVDVYAENAAQNKVPRPPRPAATTHTPSRSTRP